MKNDGVDLAIIGKALDELMLCKSRPIMGADAKGAWIKRLARYRIEAIVWAIECAIDTPGWPEYSTVAALCREHRTKRPEIYAREEREGFGALMIDLSKNQEEGNANGN